MQGAEEGEGRLKLERERNVRIVIRKKGGHGGHHGGAWKVAFADFMTSMMAVFLVLWIITQSSDVKSAIAGYFQDPLGRANEFGSSIIPGQGAQASNVQPLTEPQLLELRRDRLLRLGEQIRKRLEQSPDFANLREHIELTLTDDGLRVTLLEDENGIFFQTGSAVPQPKVADLLRQIGAELAKVVNPVIVEGHTDARAYVGRRDYDNWELSADRANMARRLLSMGGLPVARIRQVRGYADRQLRVPADPLAASNRRVAIVIGYDDQGADTAVAAPAAPAPATARAALPATPSLPRIGLKAP